MSFIDKSNFNANIDWQTQMYEYLMYSQRPKLTLGAWINLTMLLEDKLPSIDDASILPDHYQHHGGDPELVDQLRKLSTVEKCAIWHVIRRVGELRPSRPGTPTQSVSIFSEFAEQTRELLADVL